jgi:hypothetical protein
VQFKILTVRVWGGALLLYVFGPDVFTGLTTEYQCAYVGEDKEDKLWPLVQPDRLNGFDTRCFDDLQQILLEILRYQETIVYAVLWG